MDTLLVEIRAGEGGNDAKLLVEQQLTIYTRYAKRKGLELELVDVQPGAATVRVRGRGAAEAFAREAGGHRWQRVPPTERRGRVHSSTVTVAVLREPRPHEVRLDPADLKFERYRASGPGGQHRNTTDSAVRVTHLPTGLQATAETKSQHRNRELALAVLRARVQAEQERTQRVQRDHARKTQVGTGMRADKVRTVAEQRGRVENHLNGRRIALRSYLRGDLDGLL
ncbi:MAG: peptide chain release factor-like protein [Planctomycetota bacterium]